MDEEPEIKDPITSSKDQFNNLEETYRERLPKNWEEMNMAQKLDWFVHRILLDLREATDREETKDWGFLSDYQLERRRRREVNSKLEGWDDIPPRQGVFRRTYVDKNNFLTGRDPDEVPKTTTQLQKEEEDGQKNQGV
jgi:hypothetical protein